MQSYSEDIMPYHAVLRVFFSEGQLLVILCAQESKLPQFIIRTFLIHFHRFYAIIFNFRKATVITTVPPAHAASRDVGVATDLHHEKEEGVVSAMAANAGCKD